MLAMPSRSDETNRRACTASVGSSSLRSSTRRDVPFETLVLAIRVRIGTRHLPAGIYLC
jgi:hypothetical protein